MGSKLITRLGVLAASSATMLTLVPGVAQAAPADGGINAGQQPITVNENTTYRISGLNRQEVSVNAAKVLLNDSKTGVDGDTFVLASAYVWPDGISATALSGCADAPVLLISKDALTKSVSDLLKAQKPTRIIISGGPNTISKAVEAELYALLGKTVKIERNAGANRYQVAYNNAAEAAECYMGTSLIKTAHDKLQADTLAEQAYQDALAAYNKARDNYAAAKAADDKADALVQSLIEQLNTEAAKLVSVPGSSQAEYDAAAAAQQTAAEKQATIAAAAATINTLATKQLSTAQLNSPLSDYLAKATTTEAAAIRAAMKTLSLTEDQTINQAIAAANTQLDDANAAVGAANQALADAYTKLYLAAKAIAANKPVLDNMAAINIKLIAAKKAAVATQAALDAAKDKLDAAAAALGTAIGNRPVSTWQADDAKALETARDATVKAAGKYTDGQGRGISPYLATGSVYSDALTTGPAAANTQGVVLLTQGDQLGTQVKRWAKNFSATGKEVVDGQYVAVGGQAIKAAGNDQVISVSGTDRYDVSVNLADKFFKGKVYPTVASGEVFTDAVSAGSFSAQYYNPLLLTRKAALPIKVDNYLRQSNELSQPAGAVVVGGPVTVSAAAMTQALSAIKAQ